MGPDDLSKEVSVKFNLGHLLLAWNVISSKFSDLQSHEELTEDERRAIWGLEDLLEKSLIENGITEKSQPEWEALINKAKSLVQSMPVDFLD